VIHLAGLPEKIRRTLEKLVAEMRIRENIYGVGLFGSWGRGDAVASSDIDLLVLDKGDFDAEYVERIELNGLLVDLDHVPKRWISGPIPPEVDQKLYEMQILYDRDWSLHNTKLLMTKSYNSPERVDIRTETYVVDSDIYLSRATSAFSREDFRSAIFFATVALESILKVLVEIALEPFSNSRFVEKLEASAAKLGMPSLFNEYLEIMRLNEVDNSSVKEKVRLFKVIWDEMKATVTHNLQALEFSHFKVRTKLNYYLDPGFLQGMVMRANSLIESGKVAEASRYLNVIFLDIVENYAWLKSSINKVKVDYSTLMRSLEGLEEKNLRNYSCIVRFLELSDATKPDASRIIEKVREKMLKIRSERNILIKNYL
jgi:predicted nucleotidyltransferase